METHRTDRALYSFPTDMPTSTLGEYGSCIGRLYRSRHNWPLVPSLVNMRAEAIHQPEIGSIENGATYPTCCDVRDRPLLSSDSG